jgi:plasma kallikrein
LVLTVRAGEWDVSNKDELYQVEDRDVVEIITHKNFNEKTLSNDVALLFIASPFPMNVPTIATICLPPTGYNAVGQQCVVSGWGKDQFGKEGNFQNILKKIDQPTITNSECQTQLRKSKLGQRFVLHSTFVCAGGPGVSACQGDGGSPLVSQQFIRLDTFTLYSFDLISIRSVPMTANDTTRLVL